MSIPHHLTAGVADPRTRRFVRPTRVVSTRGSVENAAALLEDKPLQVTLVEPELTTLKNAGIPTEKAEVILDFGCELHGSLRLVCFGVEGQKPATLRLTFGESVAEAMSDIGEKNATNDHTLRDFTVGVPEFSDQEFGETGFRFVRIRLEDADTTVTLKATLAVFIYRDLPYLGTFRCSDDKLNAIFDTAAYTCHLNMQRQLWDGIKRDRLVWVGDMHPEMLTIRTVFGACGVMEEAIRFARETTPLPAWMNTFPTYSLWWLCMVWDWYEYSGDAAFLAENKDYAMELAAQVAALIHEDGSHDLPGNFIDWPTCGKPESADGVVALLTLAMQAAGKLAAAVADGATATLCGNAVTALRRHPVAHHGAKQIAALLALAGLTNTAAASDTIREGGAKGLSTFMSYYILKVAATASVTDALDLLRDYYGGMLDMGATTFWEDFDLAWLENATPIDAPVPAGKSDIHGDNGAFCYKGFRHSLCHGWASAPTAFLAETVLGIRIEEVGCRTLRVAPDLGDLDWAEGTYPTPFGVVSVRCRRTADGVEVDVDAPAGVTVVR